MSHGLGGGIGHWSFLADKLVDKGYDVVGSSPAEFAAYIKRDSASRARAVKISGAKAE